MIIKKTKSFDLKQKQAYMLIKAELCFIVFEVTERTIVIEDPFRDREDLFDDDSISDHSNRKICLNNVLLFYFIKLNQQRYNMFN